MDILGLIRRLPEIVAYNKFDDDFFDRLNYSHTVAVLTVFAIIVTNRQFSENQIKCWVPAQFTGSYEQYVNQICFITNTYSFDMHEPLPDDDNYRHEHELKYYQWTPFILLLMAILFYIPHQCWRGLSLRSGVDLKDLIEAAQTFRSANIRQEDKLKLLEYLTNWLNSYCSNAYRLTTNQTKRVSQSPRKALCRHVRRCLSLPLGIYTGNYLIISYLLIKFLYLFNSLGQIFLLNGLLGRKFWFYGIEIIHRYWTKQIGLLHSGNEYFPKVVLCDFSIREPNHPKESHRYTVQCVLPFNLFNQQIFTYLYFWLVLLSCFNFLSILRWLYRMSPYNNFHYLERRLTLHFLPEHQQDQSNDLRRQFVYRYLQGDGTFMLRLIAANVSDFVCTKIILELFEVFRQSIERSTIGRESLFKSLSIAQLNLDEDEKKNPSNHNEDDDGSTDQTIAVDVPPIPNPRQGKIFVERDESSEPQADIEHQNMLSVDSQSVPPILLGEHGRVRSSTIPLLKDIRRGSEIQTDSSELTTPVYKNLDFQLEPEIILSSTSPPPLSSLGSSAVKGPTPYATTYLTTKKRQEHELPYIDDSMSSSSTSGRLTSTTIVRQSDRPTTTTTTLATTDVFFRRSHDV